jgi:hypothetical protein
MSMSQLKVVKIGRDVIVLGTDQIKPAADFAGLDPTKQRWGGSFSARFVLHRDGTVSAVSGSRGRDGVQFSNVREVTR